MGIPVRFVKVKDVEEWKKEHGVQDISEGSTPEHMSDLQGASEGGEQQQGDNTEMQ